MIRVVLFILALAFAWPAAPSPAAGQDAPAAAVDEEAAAADAELAARVRGVLGRIPELENVVVEAGAGVVTLSGEVPTAEKRDAAAELAAKIDGVLWVDNRVTVTEEAEVVADPDARDDAIREQLEGIFANVSELQDVDVSVSSGVVRLQGRVLTETAKTKAEELAGSIEGVVYVENALEDVREVKERISPALERAREVVSQFVASLPLLGLGALILMIFFFLGRVVTTIRLPFRRLENKPLVLGIVQQVVRFLVLGAGVLLVLELFDLTALVGALLGTAGVAGLALGFAFRDIGENYLASIMLSLRQPFQQGDLVRVDTHEGKVVRLTTRETVLMTLDGNHLRIPNSIVFKSIIYNYTRNPLRRFDFTVGVGLNEDLVVTVRIGLDALCNTAGVLDDPAAFGWIEGLGDSSVNLRFFAWIDQRETDLGATKSAAMRRVKEAYDEAGVDLPEPTTRVLQRVWEPPPKKPLQAPHDAPPAREAPAADQIDAQIARERASSTEPDLLD